MNIKKHIPNFLTCCNLLCGCIGIVEVFKENLAMASYLVFLACIFDFLDGFAARILKVISDIGKELDSLADVVTFGVLPSLIIFQLINWGIILNMTSPFIPSEVLKKVNESSIYFVSFIAFSIAIFSAIRLAKFNIDTRQSDAFIGVPTPANAILIASFPLILPHEISEFILPELSIFEALIIDPRFLIGFSLLMSYLLVARTSSLFALKFKNFKWADNKIRFTFMGLSLLLFIFLTSTAIPIIIFLYIALSALENWLRAKS